MNTTNEQTKPLIFCLDKSDNSNLKRCLYNFSTRFFHDGKSLIKSLLLNKKTEFLPSSVILTGDVNTIKEILINQHIQKIKIFIFCQNFTRQNYELFMMESKFNAHIIGLFTTNEDLTDALEDILIKPIHNRQLIRFVTDNLDSYLWYDFLKQTSFKIDTTSSKQSIDIASINRQIEYDPLITLYTLRSPIRNLSHRTPTNKKIFYGTVLKKDIIEQLQSNIDNLISFNSFIHLQGSNRSLDARQQSLQCCSRCYDEVSVLFELELSDQPTFKIIRIFNSNDAFNLWIVQLVGTHECVKISKQFSRVKSLSTSLIQYQQPEILFGQILIEMKEINKAYMYFFQILINQHDQLSSIYTKVNDLWIKEENYSQAIQYIANEFQKIKTNNKGTDELTYLESEFDSTWETPIALQDANKINDLLPPISYRVDQVLCVRSTPKLSTTTSLSTRNRCTLF